MKRLTKLALVAVLVLACSSTVYAQKFGYINSQELIGAMPERDSVQVKLERLQEELSSQLETIQVEFNNKYLEYQKNLATYSESVRQLKEKELQDLQTRHDEFNQIAQRDFTNTQTALMTPVINRAQEAIDKVSKANGFTLVFDSAAGGLLYQNESTVINLLPLVKTELGIKDK